MCRFSIYCPLNGPHGKVVIFGYINKIFCHRHKLVELPQCSNNKQLITKTKMN